MFSNVGKVVNTKDASEAVRLGDLDWKVVKKEIQTTSDPHLELPCFRGVFRQDNGLNLGVVGSGYGVVQNDEAAGVVTEVANLATLDTWITHAGEIYGGDKVFLNCDVGDPIWIGTEKFIRSMVCSWSHNGSAALKFAFMLRRARTNILLNVDVPGLQSEVVIRHTKNAKKRLKDASKVLKKALAYFEGITEKMDILAATTLLDSEFKDMLLELFPNPTDPDKEKGRSATIANNNRKEVTDLYKSGVGSDSFRGSKLGGFLAVAEWNDQKRTSVRKDKETFGKDEVELNGKLFGQRNKDMKSAFAQLLSA